MKGPDRRPHFHVTAALIRKGGRVLIAQRPENGHLAGAWEFPGGKQENGESLRNCLAREIREELGCEIRADKEFMTIEHDYASKSISLHVFECTVLKGEPVPMESQEIRWVEPAGLAKVQMPPPDRKVAEALCGEKK